MIDRHKISCFKEGDRVVLKPDYEFSEKEWRESYGQIPMRDVHTVSHSQLNSTCVHLKLPENWEAIGCHNYNNGNGYDVDPKRVYPWGYGFYADNFTYYHELPEDLFEI